MATKVFGEEDILHVLSKGWYSLEQVTKKLELTGEYERRWLVIKLKNLEKSSEIKSVSIGGIIFWKIKHIIEIYPDYEFQIKKYEELLENNKHNYEALYSLAKIAEEKGEYKKASNYFRKCIELNRDEPDANFGLIRTYFKNGELFNAYNLLKKQKQVPLAHSNFASYILVDVGYHYLKGGKEEEALEKFEKAIEYEYENDDAYYEIGIIQFKSKNFTQAVVNFRFALEFSVEEIPNDPGIKRWTCYFYAMQEIDSLHEALEVFEFALSSANYDVEYWELLLTICFEFDMGQKGLFFLYNFIRNEIDENNYYNEYDKKTIINLHSIFLETFLDNLIQEAFSFYFPASSDCSLKDLQEFIRKSQSLIEIDEKELKFRVIELIQKKMLPIRVKEGRYHLINEEHSQEGQIKHVNELVIRTYISQKVHMFLPSPTDRNIKKFAKNLELFTKDFSNYQKYVVSKELISIMKAWDKLKPKIWKKILKETAKFLSGLIFL